MDKETLLRLATPASIMALAISIMTLPLTVKAYGDLVKVKGEIRVYNSYPFEVEIKEKSSGLY